MTNKLKLNNQQILKLNNNIYIPFLVVKVIIVLVPISDFLITNLLVIKLFNLFDIVFNF